MREDLKENIDKWCTEIDLQLRHVFVSFINAYGKEHNLNHNEKLTLLLGTYAKFSVNMYKNLDTDSRTVYHVMRETNNFINESLLKNLAKENK